MKKLVKTLMKLQGLDNRLNDLKLQKGDLPVIIEGMSGDLKEKKSRSEELADQTHKLQNDRKIFEKEIEASNIQLKKFEDKLYSVQNNKEYDAISMEIDTKKAEIESLESKIIQTMEAEDEIKSEIVSLNEEVSQLDDQLSQNRVELEEIDEQTHSEEDQLLVKRDEIAKEIDQRFLRQYERISKAKSGIAVAPVLRGSCGGCFSAIPAQRIVEIKQTNRLMTCEYCGRILIWDDEQSSL